MTGRVKESTRRAILASGLPCHLCGKPGADTVDHLIPQALGGSHEADNLAPAHRRCNSSRGKRPIPRRIPSAGISELGITL